MVNAVSVVEFKMSLFIVTVTEKMEAMVCFGIELLYTIWRYYGAVGFGAVINWNKKIIARI